MSKELLLKLTRKDFRWVYFNGTGGGGQHRNKHANCVRLFHDPSGASAVSQEERDKTANERKAFARIADTKEFKIWLKAQAMIASGEYAIIEAKVDQELFNCKVETLNEKGKWEENKDLAITEWDVRNSKE